MDEDELVEVYRARDTTHAHLLRMQLEDSGIPTFVEGDQLQGAIGGLPVGWSIAPRLMVDAALADQARELLTQWETMPPGGFDDDPAGGAEAD